MTTKTKVKNEVKGHKPKMAHPHPLRDVCVQYGKEQLQFPINRPGEERGRKAWTDMLLKLYLAQLRGQGI